MDNTTTINPIFGFKGPNFQQQIQTFPVQPTIPIQPQIMTNPLVNPNFQFQFQQNPQQMIQNQFVQNMNKQ